MRIATAALIARSAFPVLPSLRLASIFLATVCAYQCAAQTTAPVPPHTLAFRSAPPAQSEAQEQFVPYWTAESGWHTELMLRNNLSSDPLTVTPTLRLGDGTELGLLAVDIAPGTVASVNVHDALMKSHPDAMNLANLYGSVVLRYTSPSDTNLFASVMVHDEGHPIMFHLDGTYSVPTHGSGDREGIWWLPQPTTRGYLILSNMSDKAQNASLLLYDPAGTPSKQAVTIPPKQTLRLSVPDLISRTGWSADHGGLALQMPEGTGRLSSALILYDETAAFSATMKMFDWDPAITLKSHDYAKTGKWTTRAAMLALEHADPALQLPAQVVLHPQLFIHNIAAHPVEAKVALHWRGVESDNPSDGRVPLPAMTLAPFETRVVNIKQLQDAGTLPPTASWAQVTLTTNSLPGEVVAVASSFDDTLRYGVQTPFSDQLAFHLEGGSWRVDANHDSIIAAGNGGNKPVKARLTFFYAGGTKRYEIERAIPADDQMWIDMGKLIREGIPDAKGNVLPSDLTTGAYQLLNLEQTPEPVLYEGKIVTDKTFGHATYGCMICCGIRTPQLTPNPLLSLIFQDVGFTAVGVDACTSQKTDLYNYVDSWWSDNTAIMTVNPGRATGAGVGSTTLNVDMPNLPARGITDGVTCPIQDVGASGPGNVKPTVTISGPSTITAGGISTYTITASGKPTGGTYTFTTSGSTIASLSNTSTSTRNTTNIAGTASGTVTVTVTYTVSAAGGEAQPATNSTNISILLANNLLVANDTTQTVACPAGNQIRRKILYTIQSGTQPITDGITMAEVVPNPTVDSCGVTVGTGASGFVSSSVQPENNDQFIDVLGDCPTANNTCSFNFPKQQWKQLSPSGIIATIGPVIVTSKSVSVNGNTTNLVGIDFKP